MIHEIPLERRTLHGHFSRELEPILSIEPGESIAFACPNAGWELDPGERFEPHDEELDAGHALIGPVEVRGAKAGGTLVVHDRRGHGRARWGVDVRDPRRRSTGCSSDRRRGRPERGARSGSRRSSA